jgi:hypothetical protein
MAYLTDIERLNYYEGEYLGALDFAAEQDYHRDMRRRHNVGQHTWGIVSGLDLAQVPNGQTSGGLPEVDIYVQPGMATDGFGREILALSRTQLTQDLFAAFYDPNAKANPRNMYVWIAYQQQFARASSDVCASKNNSNPYGRVQEGFRLLVTTSPTPVPALNDPLVVDGGQMTPPLEPATPPSPPATPNPGEIVLPYDGAVPYQEFAEDDTTTQWYVLLGQVLWDPHQQIFLQTGSTATGRQYAGAVAAAIQAPAGQLLIEDRTTPYPLPSDPAYTGVAVEIAGALTVDRLLTAMQDVWIYEPGHLYFKDDNGTDGDTPLWIRRNTNAAGGADLHIHIGDNSDAKNKPQRLTVANGPTGDESKEQTVFDVRADGNVDIPIGALNFASQTRQMINLWSFSYGIGVQSGTEYFRSDYDFCWFRQGTHSDNQSDPGAGGTLAMKLDSNSRLTVSGDVLIPTGALNFASQTRQMINLWSDHYAIGVQSCTEYFRSDYDFCWFRQGTHSDTRNDPGAGGVLAMKLDNSSRLTLSGDAIVNGNLGIGTTTPGLRLDVKGDFGRDDGAAQVHLWGSRVGDVGNGMLFLRSGGGVVTFDGGDNVGVGTTTPGYLLDVADRMRVRQGASGTSGIFFFQSSPNADRAFVGMESDNQVGFWGSTIGWGAVMNTTNGSISVKGNLGTAGHDPDSGYPMGWAGGVHTWDVYAEGSISSPNKHFVINHPLDPEGKHLVHSTLEGPEIAVFYRGEARLSKGKATITLPNYFEALTRKENRTVLLTPKFASGASITLLAASEVHSGKFTVHAADHGNQSQEFFWEVKAVRSDVRPLEIELQKLPANRTKARPSAPATTVP